MEAAQHPFEEGRHVVRVGVATKAKTIGERKPSALVFLVDVSGSMSSEDKLPLARKALHILTDNLAAKDAVAIVTYAGSSSLVLPMTSIDHKAKIHEAIDTLSSGGSTAMAKGIDDDLALISNSRFELTPGETSARTILSTSGSSA